MLPHSIIERSNQLLQQGMNALHMPVGIVSHIYGDNYEIVALKSAAGSLKVGSVLPLAETYCRDVVSSRKTIALTEIDGVKGLRRHPLYLKMPLEAYISAPIFSHGHVWGTINFTSFAFRTPFSSSDIPLVESYANQLSMLLSEYDNTSRSA